MSENYGDFFQQKSKYIRGKLPNHHLNWANKPETYKKYENPISTVSLPDPEFNENLKFWDILIKRRSIRKFSSEPLKLNIISLLLFGISGLTRISSQFAFRTTPSAGGLYPIETYTIINNVSGLDQGIYHYYIPEHNLECLKKGDFKKDIAEACLGQDIAAKSAVTFVWSAIIERSKWKYLQRCYRYIYLDCGHIGQNFYLVSEALQLGACTIGAIFDDELNKLLDLDGLHETAIYVGVVGNRKFY